MNFRYDPNAQCFVDADQIEIAATLVRKMMAGVAKSDADKEAAVADLMRSLVRDEMADKAMELAARKELREMTLKQEKARERARKRAEAKRLPKTFGAWS